MKKKINIATESSLDFGDKITDKDTKEKISTDLEVKKDSPSNADFSDIKDINNLDLPEADRFFLGPGVPSKWFGKFLSEFSLKELYGILKNNISTLAIIIPTLGACIQIYQLGNIHISYLRYFSATQVASDSAVALIILVPFIILYLLYSQLIPTRSQIKYLSTDEFKTKELSKFNLIIIAIVCSFSYLTCYYIMNSDIYLNPLLYLLISSSMIAACIGSMFLSYYFSINLKVRKDANIIGNILNILHPLIISSYLLITILFVFNLLGNYFEMYRVPYNFENNILIADRVDKDYINTKLNGFQLLYFNDKYTFVEIDKVNIEKKIRVYKTDDILFNNEKKLN